METRKYETIDASPVKRFFVEMLTRDIQIEDAILDLLDNCVDGILRSSSPSDDGIETPYEGYWAKITVNGDSFEIEDNCGGIPWNEHERAFRMGRPRIDGAISSPLSVGIYGIGMKRAIFKIGQSALIATKNGEDDYQVFFTEEWINDEDNWYLTVEPNNESMPHDGTHIYITNLNADVHEAFTFERFERDLLTKIQSHYAVIMRKGFKVEVNGVIAEPNPIVVRFSPESTLDNREIRPYMFRSDFDEVQVFLAVGLREPIPGFDRISEEQEGARYSSDYAGWTVICNDRVVLYCDKNELTGWGILGVPRYHTQFIAISGVVEFRGNPSKLPTTTTKRGLKFESSLYQQVLQRMIEGIKHFIDFTNKWKTMEAEAEKVVSPIPALEYSEIKIQAQNLTFHPVRTGTIGGEQYIPKLPMPANSRTDVRISYTRPKDEVFELAEKLFGNLDDMRRQDVPRNVGLASFEYAAKKINE